MCQQEEAVRRKGESIRRFLKRSYKDLRLSGGDTYKILEDTQARGMNVDKVSLIKGRDFSTVHLEVNHIFVLVNGETVFLNNVFYLNTPAGREAFNYMISFHLAKIDAIWFYSDILVVKLSVCERNSEPHISEEVITSVIPVFTANNKYGTTELSVVDRSLVIKRGAEDR